MSSNSPSRFLPMMVTALGFVLIVVAVCVAVSHFGYGNPIRQRNSNEVNSSAAVLFYVLLFGAAGIVVACGGIATLVLSVRRRRSGPFED